MRLSVGEIAKACKGRLVTGERCTPAPEETLVDSVVLDSRRVTPGGVFVATVGERVDGHRFIPQVFAAGAALAVTEKTPEQVEAECGVPASEWGSYLLVEDSFQALKDMAEYYRGKLDIPIVGITGSVGKTSTKEFIAGVLAEKYRVLKTEGNFNNEVGVPLTLLRIREEHEAAVVEMGISDFGEMHRLSKMARPDICVITNIGQCHLENLGDRDGILRAKTEIFDYMPATGEVCLNGEDDKLRTLKEIALGRYLEACGGTAEGVSKKPHFFGMGDFDCEEVFADHVVSRGLRGSDAVIHMIDAENMTDMSKKEETVDAQIPLPGAHMVINGAAAACVARLLGLDREQIRAGLRKVQPVGGRDNLLYLEHYTVIDDCYNANPVSMKAALDLLATADTYKVAILGDMFELGENSAGLHAETGAYAVESGIDCIICVGENSRHMYEGAKGNSKGAAEYETAGNAAQSIDMAQTRRGGNVAQAAGDSNVAKAAQSGDIAQTAGAQRVLYFESRDELMKSLEEQGARLIPEGCTILVKASHGMEFNKVVEYLHQRG